MRKEPANKYEGLPCSYVTVGCAYENILDNNLIPDMPDNIRKDGYLTLYDANRYFRDMLPVCKRVRFKKDERPLLKDFLAANSEKCCICVLGHFVYANADTYWSFFDNDNDEVVNVWYIKL